METFKHNYSYRKANLIRTKLLLFIDKELIQSKNTKPQKKLIVNQPVQEKILFTEQNEYNIEEIHYFSNDRGLFNENKITINSDDINKYTTSGTQSTFVRTPRKSQILHQNINFRYNHQHKTNEYKIGNNFSINQILNTKKSINSDKVVIKNNEYFVRIKTKNSSTILYKKNIKKDSNYLINLCLKFKKEKKKRKTSKKLNIVKISKEKAELSKRKSLPKKSETSNLLIKLKSFTTNSNRHKSHKKKLQS